MLKMATPIASTQIRWRRSSQAETDAGGLVSAPCYGRAEDVRVVAVVVPKFELGNVQRQVLAADLVEAAHDAALQQRPKAVDGLRVNDAIDVLLFGMPHDAMREFLAQVSIARMFVGRDQADLFRHGHVHESFERLGIGAVDDARHNVALAADSADDRRLAGTFTAASAVPLIPMLVVSLAADVGFIDLDNAHELAEFRVDKACANAVAHVVRGPIRAKTHHALHLKGAHALLTGQHEIDDFEPRPQTDVCVFEDRSDQYGKPIAALFGALSALPVKGPPGDRINIDVAAARAENAIGPAALDKILLASIVSGKQRLELRGSHLRREFLALLPGHDGIPHQLNG
jgi:hypothetical protein